MLPDKQALANAAQRHSGAVVDLHAAAAKLNVRAERAVAVVPPPLPPPSSTAAVASAAASAATAPPASSVEAAPTIAPSLPSAQTSSRCVYVCNVWLQQLSVSRATPHATMHPPFYHPPCRKPRTPRAGASSRPGMTRKRSGKAAKFVFQGIALVTNDELASVPKCVFSDSWFGGADRGLTGCVHFVPQVCARSPNTAQAQRCHCRHQLHCRSKVQGNECGGYARPTIVLRHLICRSQCLMCAASVTTTTQTNWQITRHV